jgi:hypothetical protein
MTWIAPLSPAKRRIGSSHAIVPQSRGACTLGVVVATGHSPTPAPGGWSCALPAARRPQAGRRSRACQAWSDGPQPWASRLETLWHPRGALLEPCALAQRHMVADACAVSSRRRGGCSGVPLGTLHPRLMATDASLCSCLWCRLGRRRTIYQRIHWLDTAAGSGLGSGVSHGHVAHVRKA